MKNFIYGDFESKYERTVFKKVPGAPPVAIFYTQSGKELERVNLEKFDRYVHVSLTFNLFSVCVSVLIIHCIIYTLSQCREELNKMMVSKGIPLKAKHDEV